MIFAFGFALFGCADRQSDVPPPTPPQPPAIQAEESPPVEVESEVLNEAETIKEEPPVTENEVENQEGSTSKSQEEGIEANEGAIEKADEPQDNLDVLE